jgi:hypothetical protein
MTRVMIGVVYPYLKRIGLALSILLNVLLGGKNNQSFSARNYVWQKRGRHNLVWLIDLFLGYEHCQTAWVYYQLRTRR